jgi:LmbE family N-acetylglucosaminyl deacetylase
MVHLELNSLKNVLCLGAHSDDIEIGCGGTIRTLLGQKPGLNVVWIVFSGSARRRDEAKASAQAFLEGAGTHKIILKTFKDGFFPMEAGLIKAFFEQLKAQTNPDLIFTHFREDRHQDHRVLSDLTWNTFRDHLILEYEIPKYDGDLQQPNTFVSVDERTSRFKASSLCRFFQTQGNKHWFSEDLFLGLMRLRGIECASKTGYAEAFYMRKATLLASGSLAAEKPQS